MAIDRLVVKVGDVEITSPDGLWCNNIIRVDGQEITNVVSFVLSGEVGQASTLTVKRSTEIQGG